MKKSYKYLLFDWDGCLADTLPAWLESYKKVFFEFGFEPTDEEITSKVFGDWSGPLNVGLPEHELPAYTERLMAVVTPKLSEVKLHSGVKQLLKQLQKNNEKMAIITTSKLGVVQPALVREDIEKYFLVVLTAKDVKKHKPNPEIVNKTIKLLKGKKEEALVIGDSRKDIEAANNAGVDSVLFFPKKHEKIYELKELLKYKPTYVIGHFDELLDVLNI